MKEPGSPVLDGRTILLVEDEALIAMELEFGLEQLGAVVYGPIPNLVKARAAAAEGSFDAAILDVDLGGEDVFPVARELQEREVPFVFHTGHGQRFELTRDFPNAPVFKKPMSGEELARGVARLLAGQDPCA